MIRTIDKGLAASARVADNTRQLARRTYGRSATIGFALLGALVAGAANAQTPTGYGLGANGAPGASDYLTAGTGFASAIGPILTAMLPLLLGMLAVWQGPRIIKSLVQKFSR